MFVGGVVEPPGRPGAPRALSAWKVHMAAGRSLGALYLLVLCHRPLPSLEPFEIFTTAISVVWGGKVRRSSLF